MLFNVHEMSCTLHSKFGQGILKKGEDESVRNWIGVGHENDGRAVLPFDNSNTCVAKLMVVLGFILTLGLKEWNDVFGVIRPKAWMRSTWYIFMISSIFLFGKFGAGFIYGNL